jgi:starvation-inducible DNA-binding protein
MPAQRRQKPTPISFTAPGLDTDDAATVATLLQERLNSLTDLSLTLKHVHWNVVGPNFIGVHEMIDPQVELVRRYADEVAERIAALGKSPQGTPGAILKDRTWDDYSVDRDTVQAHLAALDLVYTGVIEDTRKCIDTFEDLDLVSQDMLINHAGELEKFQWFVRAHLENSGGQLANKGATTEKSAATRAKKKAPVK